MTKFAIVPIIPTEDMDSIFFGQDEDAYAQLLTTSPNEGKVSREQIDDIALLILENIGFSSNSSHKVAELVVGLLNLSVEGAE